MYSANFDYYRPATLAEAVALLGQHQGAKVLAGGHSLLPAMKLRATAPSAIVDIGRIKGLAGISVAGDMLKIGALTTHDAIAASEVVKARCPILAETAMLIGDQQVRNRGTIGGSLAHADPASDFPTVIVALKATLTATGPDGERKIPAEQFFTDLFTTALGPEEILTSISVVSYGSKKNIGGAYLKHRHPASNYSVVGVAAVLELKNGKCSAADLVIGGATANPVRVKEAEKILTGQTPDEANLDMAAEKVNGAITNPLSDFYASGEYRTHLAKVLAKRALMKAVERARG